LNVPVPEVPRRDPPDVYRSARHLRSLPLAQTVQKISHVVSTHSTFRLTLTTDPALIVRSFCRTGCSLHSAKSLRLMVTAFPVAACGMRVISRVDAPVPL